MKARSAQLEEERRKKKEEAESRNFNHLIFQHLVSHIAFRYSVS